MFIVRAQGLRRARFGALSLIVVLAVSAGPAYAFTYDTNQGAAGLYGGPGRIMDGLAGFQMLTQLVAQPGHFIAHPGQILPSFSTDFIGFGTAKGLGVANCPDQWGPSWQVYVDGTVYGTYFCEDLQYISGGAQSQSFIVQRHAGQCSPSEPGPGWDVKWQGVTRSCISQSFSSTDFIGAGAENGNNQPNQAIRIDYVQMQYRNVGTTYGYWGSYTRLFDAPYTITPFGTRTSYSIAP